MRGRGREGGQIDWRTRKRTDGPLLFRSGVHGTHFRVVTPYRFRVQGECAARSSLRNRDVVAVLWPAAHPGASASLDAIDHTLLAPALASLRLALGGAPAEDRAMRSHVDLRPSFMRFTEHPRDRLQDRGGGVGLAQDRRDALRAGAETRGSSAKGSLHESAFRVRQT